MNQDELRRRIAERAYFRFLARGCRHGYDIDDWLQAEAEVLSELASSSNPARKKTTRRRTTTKKTATAKRKTRTSAKA